MAGGAEDRCIMGACLTPQESETVTYGEAFAELIAHGTASDMVVSPTSYRAKVEDDKTIRVTSTQDPLFNLVVEFPRGTLRTSSTCVARGRQDGGLNLEDDLYAAAIGEPYGTFIVRVDSPHNPAMYLEIPMSYST